MKIAVDGTHCSGKTTLAQILHSHHLRLTLIPEVSRLVAQGLGITTAADFSSLLADRNCYNKFLEDIHSQQIEIEKRHSSFIIDSSIFRNLAYASTILNKPAEAFDYDFGSHKYDLVLYCLPVDYTGDNFRFSDFQESVDICLRRILTHFCQPYIVLPQPLSARVREAHQQIARMKALVDMVAAQCPEVICTTPPVRGESSECPQ